MPGARGHRSRRRPQAGRCAGLVLVLRQQPGRRSEGGRDGDGCPPGLSRREGSRAAGARRRGPAQACIVHPAAECATAAAQSRELFAELGDDFRTALSTTLLAVEAIGSSAPGSAFELLTAADQEFERDEDVWCSALVRFVEMELHAVAGEMDEAVASANRALEAFRTLGDQWAISAIQFHLGKALHRTGGSSRP